MNICQPKEAAQFRSVDPAEENDADDEGEIWYNPIPEDEEPEISQRPFVRLLVPSRAASQRRPSRGGDAGHLLEVPGENLDVGGLGDGSQGNSTHSSDTLQLHRHMLVCKPQEEGGATRAAGMVETSWIPSFPCILKPLSFKPSCTFPLLQSQTWCLFSLLFGSYTLITNYSLWSKKSTVVCSCEPFLRFECVVKMWWKFKSQYLNGGTNAAPHLYLLWKELCLSNHISPHKRPSLVKPRWTLARRNSAPAFLRGKNIPLRVSHAKSRSVFIHSVFNKTAETVSVAPCGGSMCRINSFLASGFSWGTKFCVNTRWKGMKLFREVQCVRSGSKTSPRLLFSTDHGWLLWQAGKLQWPSRAASSLSP